MSFKYHYIVVLEYNVKRTIKIWQGVGKLYKKKNHHNEIGHGWLNVINILQL